jgi:hypothetical protein
VPTILIGRDHDEYAAAIHTIADIAAVVRRCLGLPLGDLQSGSNG